LNADESRKIIREALPTGDLLFSKAIILFEGETEAQSFPIFVKKYWGKEAHDIGLTLIKVNGNNYKPFLAVAKAMDLPWFIFSDYDQPNIRQGVDNVISSQGLNPEDEHPNVAKLGCSVEEYLISENYQNELKKGIFEEFKHSTPSATPQYITAKETEIFDFSEEVLKDKMGSDYGKVSYPRFWAEEITALDGERSIPTKIRSLFDAIEEKVQALNSSGDES
jgi:putative ATP-dependent endonuclease of OLD family